MRYLLAIIFLGIFGSSSAWSALTHDIAIADFTNVNNDPELDNYTRSIPMLIFAHLANSQKLSLVQRHELDKLLGAWTAGFAPHELMQKLQAAGVPAGAVQQYNELMDEDPQIKHRRTFGKLARSAAMENISHLDVPWNFAKTRRDIMPIPKLGEHTMPICEELLAMPDEEFVELLMKGVLEVAD